MFCIAAFIIFAILGIFSASYRSLAKKAWQCVVKRITFKPCEIGFKEELKSRLLSRIILTKPRLAKSFDRWIDVLAFVFVVLTIWSFLVVLNSGLSLLVYDTCNPNDAESCAFGGQTCSIGSAKPGFWDSLKQGKILIWGKDTALTFGETVSNIPNRFKNWNPADYVNERNTYYKPFDEQKPIALEIIDPGCKFCAQLFGNIKQAGFEERYNLTYIAYPISDQTTGTGYKFPHSYLVASYLEAVKLQPLASQTPADWQILEKIFTQRNSNGLTFQEEFNLVDNEQQVSERLESWLFDMGYSADKVVSIRLSADSEQVKEIIAANNRLVEDEIETKKIPTIMFNGRRYDRVVDVDKLKE